MYSTGDILKQFEGLKRQTLANWCDEFRLYFTPTVTPINGENRRFEEQDLTIIALIRSLKAAGYTYEQIHVRLQQGERLDIPDNKALITAPVGTPLAIAQMRLAEQEEIIEKLSEEIQQLKIDVAVGKRAENELREARDKIEQLNREIGRLEGKG